MARVFGSYKKGSHTVWSAISRNIADPDELAKKVEEFKQIIEGLRGKNETPFTLEVID